MIDTTLLIERVLERCQRQRWFGGDSDNTARYSYNGYRYEENYTRDGVKIVTDNDPDDHPYKTSFAYPPATEEQLLQTTQALGFPLPPLLQTLYTHIANGGFGPGHGLIGALGGFCEAGDIVDCYQFHVQRSQFIDLEDYIRSDKILVFPETVWPRYMLYLCDHGDAVVTCLDCVNDAVYVRRPGCYNLHYLLEPQSLTLAQWLEQWLESELKYDPNKPIPVQGETHQSFFLDDIDPPF